MKKKNDMYTRTMVYRFDMGPHFMFPKLAQSYLIIAMCARALNYIHSITQSNQTNAQYKDDGRCSTVVYRMWAHNETTLIISAKWVVIYFFSVTYK